MARTLDQIRADVITSLNDRGDLPATTEEADRWERYDPTTGETTILSADDSAKLDADVQPTHDWMMQTVPEYASFMATLAAQPANACGCSECGATYIPAPYMDDPTRRQLCRCTTYPVGNMTRYPGPSTHVVTSSDDASPANATISAVTLVPRETKGGFPCFEVWRNGTYLGEVAQNVQTSGLWNAYGATGQFTGGLTRSRTAAVEQLITAIEEPNLVTNTTQPGPCHTLTARDDGMGENVTPFHNPMHYATKYAADINAYGEGFVREYVEFFAELANDPTRRPEMRPRYQEASDLLASAITLTTQDTAHPTNTAAEMPYERHIMPWLEDEPREWPVCPECGGETSCTGIGYWHCWDCKATIGMFGTHATIYPPDSRATYDVTDLHWRRSDEADEYPTNGLAWQPDTDPGERRAEAFAIGGMQAVNELDPGFDPYIPEDDSYGDPDDYPETRRYCDRPAAHHDEAGDPWCDPCWQREIADAREYASEVEASFREPTDITIDPDDLPY